jgi:hypothetical protein
MESSKRRRRRGVTPVDKKKLDKHEIKKDSRKDKRDS